MTITTTRGVPGQVAGHTALRRLVADPVAFGRDVWSREALLTTADRLEGDVAELFDEAAVDELVSTHGLRTPFLRVARDGDTLPQRAFTAGAGVGAGIADQLDDTRLTALFAEGATLVLQALHRTWPPVLRFSQQLAAELGHPVQVNAYVTPPQSRGFDDHYDVHDVFVLQVSGEKHWRIHRPVHPAPLRDQPWTDRRAAVRAEAEREPVVDAVLRPGDCLYLPRGYLHAATALGDVSTHLTFGVHTWHRHHLAEELVERALGTLGDDERARASLPLGVDVADPDDLHAHAELVRELLTRAVAEVPVEELAAALARRSCAAGRPAPVGPLGQLRAAQRDDPGTVVLREHLAARLDGDRLRSRAGDLDLAPDEVPAVRTLLAGAPVASADLGPDLVRRLLRAGVVVPA